MKALDASLNGGCGTNAPSLVPFRHATGQTLQGPARTVSVRTCWLLVEGTRTMPDVIGVRQLQWKMLRLIPSCSCPALISSEHCSLRSVSAYALEWRPDDDDNPRSRLPSKRTLRPHLCYIPAIVVVSSQSRSATTQE